MAITNHERVGKALELLNRGLIPFVEREMKAVLKERWKEEIARIVHDERISEDGSVQWDTASLLIVMWDQWNTVFKRTLGYPERSMVSELRDARNSWAHQVTFSSDDAYRVLDSVHRLLQAVSAEEVGEIEKSKMELLRTRFNEQRRGEMRKKSHRPLEGMPAEGLKPWREIVTPHPDVASGKYQQAEFAADLWQVYRGEGTDEYRHPTEFFRRTYLTEGLTRLLSLAINRLTSNKGDPVVELQTNFGGGKTHAMLALYHLFSGTPATELPGVEGLLKDNNLTLPGSVHRAVFVGNRVSPGTIHKKEDGTEIRTVWGEIAWQLGGKEGYEIVRSADESATNPGDRLEVLFKKYSPCMILIDEWVAYARQLHEDATLPAGRFDTQFTFAQALTESVKNVPNALLVVSIPSSAMEIGGEWGREALDKLKNVTRRLAASWRPASPEEGFEIVRRRLFQPITDNDLFVQRDAVARAFSAMYGKNHQEFPSECREADYERRIKTAYPIHPELFDRLFTDWSSLDRFQRTRGVLRLMASVIHTLWERADKNLLIMPSSIPIDDPHVQYELTQYLEDSWVPVIEKDVDGPHSTPVNLDRNNPNYGRFSACRRVARTIYMGSAPTHRSPNRGVEDRQVKLGCVQPGEIIATFGDALRRLSDSATYLYIDGKRYWYSTQPTVTKLAEDRAGQIGKDDVMEEIRSRLKDEARHRGDFTRVHACASSNDVPDEMETRLVILGPEFPHTGKEVDTPAESESNTILNQRGSSPRTYRNTLLFLAPDKSRLQELMQSVRIYKAWSSIWEDREELNLDPQQTRQVETKKRSAYDTVTARIPETYIWILVPIQDDPKGPVEWKHIRLHGQDALAVRASRKLKNEELLLTEMGGVRLKHELDKIPLWRGEHVGIRQLMEDFAKYIYLSRVKDENVIISAIQSGISSVSWSADTFAYAEKYNEESGRYEGLKAGQASRILVTKESVVVRPRAARKQMEEDAQKAKSQQGIGSPTAPGGKPSVPPVDQGRPEKVVMRRFYGTKAIDPNRMNREVQVIADEVVQHLARLPGVKIEVECEIRAECPEGIAEDVVRTITENCTTLKFTVHAFEKE